MEILNNGVIQVGVSPEKGGRIYSFSLSGGADRFFHASSVETSSGWRNWGGDFLWVAPQSTWGWPPPDEWESVPWDLLPDRDGVLLISGLFRGVQLQRHIDFEGQNSIRVVNTLRAINESCDWGLWNITQVPIEGVKVSAARVGDVRVFEYPAEVNLEALIQSKQISGQSPLVLAPTYEQDFKVGWYDPEGKIITQYPDGVKLIKQFDPQPRFANYPHGGNVEFYRCRSYQEIEIGWSRVKLKPGESVSVTQRFTLELK